MGMGDRTHSGPVPPAERKACTVGWPSTAIGWTSPSCQKPTSRCSDSAIPRASKPGPRLADDAGTRTIGAGHAAACGRRRLRCRHEAIEGGGGPPVVEHGAGQRHALGHRRHGAPDEQPGGGVEHDHVAVRRRARRPARPGPAPALVAASPPTSCSASGRRQAELAWGRGARCE